jgi:hypothetical protein
MMYTSLRLCLVLVPLGTAALCGLAACSDVTSTNSIAADAGGSEGGSEGGGGPDAGDAAADAAACSGKAMTCPYSGPGMAGPGLSAPIVDPAACGVFPFRSDGGNDMFVTCDSYCVAQNPSAGQTPTVSCVASDAGVGAFACECFLVP